MPRGFTWSVYVDDNGLPWALQVDSDYVLQPQRGWVPVETSGLTPLPRGWLPRKAKGVETGGSQHFAVVATIDADLWTGARTDFDIRSNDGAVQTCTVIGTFEERRTPVGPDPSP